MEQFASGIDTDDLDISFERGNDPTRKNTNEQRPRPTTTSKSSTIMSAFDSLDKKSRGFRKSNLTTPQLVVTDVSQIVQRKTGDAKVNYELDIWPAVKKISDEREQPLSSCLRRASLICSRPRKNFDFDSLELPHQDSEKQRKRAIHRDRERKKKLPTSFGDFMSSFTKDLYLPSESSLTTGESFYDKSKSFLYLGSDKLGCAGFEYEKESNSVILPPNVSRKTNDKPPVQSSISRVSSDGSLPRLPFGRTNILNSSDQRRLFKQRTSSTIRHSSSTH